jgi:LysM repeat protein
LEIGDEMRRDKQFVIFIIVLAFGVTGVLHYMRSPETQRSVPYLIALENSLCVFGEDKTDDYYRASSQMAQNIEDNVIPIGYFVEEQRIIEEYKNENRFRPVLSPDKAPSYISFYISLTNDMNIFENGRGLKVREAKSSNTIFSDPNQSIRIANNNYCITHKIRANDSLSKLARKYYNDESKWKKIYQANKDQMSNPNSLKIGQELLIPNITVSSNQDKHRIIKT